MNQRELERGAVHRLAIIRHKQEVSHNVANSGSSRASIESWVDPIGGP